jgi:hypothetical protein
MRSARMGTTLGMSIWLIVLIVVLLVLLLGGFGFARR